MLLLSPLPSLPHPLAFPCSRRLPRSLRSSPAATRRGPSYSSPFSRSLASAGPGRGVGKSRVAHLVEAPACRWLPALLVTVVVLSSSAPVPALALQASLPPEDATLDDVPQTLSGGGAVAKKRIQRPKSRQAETCTVKCLGTCIQGGAGSPGEGPFNVRRPLVVFKPGFRSRNYCLVECSDICNRIKDGDDGP